MPMNATDLRIALQKLREIKTVMYVAAHPDDENTALLAYFSKGKKYRTVYLSLTRGEGGQNILGVEKGSDLGIIRTEELLAARRIDGAEQMFSRAIDFGFSKSSDETIAMWGRDDVVGDIVWAIRTVRPDIIITRFSPAEGGHGNHTASAILAEEAFKRSGDSSSYPEQLRFVRPWKAKRLFFNRLTGFGGTAPEKGSDNKMIDVGAYNPLLGLSYTEIAGISRSLHKTQAMGSELRRGKSPNYFRLTDSADPADSADLKTGGRQKGSTGQAGRADRLANRFENDNDDDLFSGLDISWKRYHGGTEIDKLFSQAEKNFDPEHPDRIAALLLKAYRQLRMLAGPGADAAADPLIARKRDETASVITACLGLQCSALSAQPRLTSGDHSDITFELIARAGVPMIVEALRSPMLRVDTTLGIHMQSNVKQRLNVTALIPASMVPSQPYWLQQPVMAQGISESRTADQHNYLYHVPSQVYTGMPENPDSLAIDCELIVSGEPLTIRVPVRYRTIDPVAGELYRRVVIVPALDVSVPDKMIVWTHAGEHTIKVHASANADVDSGEVRLVLPNGYAASPASISFPGIKKNEERTYSFTIDADSASASGAIDANVLSIPAAQRAGGGAVPLSNGMRPFTMHGIDLSYPHIVPQYVMHPAQLKAVHADMRIGISKIGFIEGSGDEVPDALRHCGYQVVTIDDDTLANGSLSSYGTIVVGVRAYNVRARIRESNSRLMEYVRNGGTLIVQYQTPGKDVESIGPYPFKISRDRVTDENAPITAAYGASPEQKDSTDPHRAIYDRIMNFPNRLSNADFNGWVQERGLSFADMWDDHYAAPFICADPNESPKQGSLIVARYGKGYYCYTGLSLFRQLPAGVAGAFRLLGNLIELH